MGSKKSDRTPVKVEEENYEYLHSTTFGVQPMTIARRMVRERERCIGMTNEERAWRAQWLKDQSIEEPLFVPERYRELNNPLRRFYHYPMNQFEKMVTPVMGKTMANITRRFFGRTAYVIITIYGCFYYFKYINVDEWQRIRGWRVGKGRTRVYPGDEGFPLADVTKTPQDFDPPGTQILPIKY